MARDPKIEVAAVNLRIPVTHNRDYELLLSRLSELRRGVKVRGETYVAISYWDASANIGILSKYTEIDIDGEWFDLDDFDTASAERVGEIKIPDGLKPNLAQFYFSLDKELHVVAFSSYSESKGLSANSVEKYFKEALDSQEVRAEFGTVESDIVKSYGEIERILSLPDLKELRLIIRRPNTDDIGGRLARVIEERLLENGGDEYEEAYRARGANNLSPNKRTEELSIVAGENGQVRAKSLVNGIMTEANTEHVPLKETTKYKGHQSELAVFRTLARKVFSRVAQARASING